MPALIDQAIVIRIWDFSETSQTAALLCRDHGLLRGLAKGARRPRSTFGDTLEPLTRGGISYIPRPSGELALLTEWDLREVFWSIRRDLQSHRAGLYMADLVYHAILDSDPHPGLFDALAGCLRALDEGHSPESALVIFQWALLSEAGFRPRLDRAPALGGTMWFDPNAGGIIPRPEAPPAGGWRGRASLQHPPWRVRSSTIEALLDLAQLPLGEGLRAAGAHDAEVITRCNKLLAAHLAVVLDRDLPTREVFFADERLEMNPTEIRTKRERLSNLD